MIKKKTDEELFVAYCEKMFTSIEAAYKQRGIIEKSFGFQKYVCSVRTKELEELVQNEFKNVVRRRFKWVFTLFGRR